MNGRMLRIDKYLIFTIPIIALACGYTDKEIFLFEQSENWGKWQAGDTTSIQYKVKAYKKGNDIIYYTTNFYPNGIEKCQTVHINDRLDKVLFVNDTSGQRLEFGKI